MKSLNLIIGQLRAYRRRKILSRIVRCNDAARRVALCRQLIELTF